MTFSAEKCETHRSDLWQVLNKKVGRREFWTILAVFIGIISGIMAVAFAQISSNTQGNAFSKTDIVQIRTDVEWIKKALGG